MARFDDTFDPEVLKDARQTYAEVILAWRYGDDENPGEISAESARFFAAIQRPIGPQLLAMEIGGDVRSPYVSITYAEALEDLFDSEADAICAERQLVIDTRTRAKLLREIGRAIDLVGGRLVQ